MRLNELEQNIVDIVAVHIDLKGYSPSLRQVAAAVDAPLATVADTVRVLQKHGLVTNQPGIARTLRLTDAGHQHRREVMYL